VTVKDKDDKVIETESAFVRSSAIKFVVESDACLQPERWELRANHNVKRKT